MGLAFDQNTQSFFISAHNGVVCMCWVARYRFTASQVSGGGMKIPAELDPRFHCKVSGAILARLMSEAVRK